MPVTLPKSGLRAQVVAAAVFVVFALGLIFFARSFRTAADAALMQEVDGVPPPTPARLAFLTPQSATNAPELLAALLKEFGTNARGMSCITFVDYDHHPDRLHITFALDTELTAPSARAAALGRIRDILRAIHAGEMRWTWVLVTGTAPTADKNGGMSEATVIRTQFLRERLNRLDWKKLSADDVQNAAEQYWVNLDLRQ